MQRVSSIQDRCFTQMSHSQALLSWSSANENEVMGILAAIVMDVERDTSQNHNTPFLQHTYSPPSVSKHAECWASVNCEIRTASLQLTAMLEASFSKRIYEEKRKKEKKKVAFFFSFDNQNHSRSTKHAQSKVASKSIFNWNQSDTVFCFFLFWMASDWVSFTSWRIEGGGVDRESWLWGCEKEL